MFLKTSPGLVRIAPIAILVAVGATGLTRLWAIHSARALAQSPLPELASRSRSEPANQALFLELGRRQLASGRSAEALASLQHAAALDESSEEAWTEWADAAEVVGGPPLALEALNRAIQHLPDSASLHANIAVLQSVAGNMAAAETESSVASRLDPEAPGTLAALGAVAMGHGDLPRAKTLLRKACSGWAEPAGRWRACERLAALLIASRRPLEAIAPARQAVDAAPGQPEAHLVLGRARLASASSPAEFQGATAELTRARELAPGIPGIGLLLGQSLLGQENWPRARAELEAAVRANPQGESEHYLLRTALARLGDRAGMEREARLHDSVMQRDLLEAGLLSRIAQGDQSLSTKLRLARVYGANQQWQAAAAQYQLLLREHPERADLQREAGQVQSHLSSGAGQ